MTAKKPKQASTSNEHEYRLAVATYNIHACIGRDRIASPERIARVICELDADIVGLQEILSRPGTGANAQQMAYLAQAAGYDAISGLTIQRPDCSYGNALLTRHPVYAVRQIDLSVPGHEPRGAIDADLETHGIPIRVVVTHLGLRAAERRLQLLRLSEQFRRDANEPTILMGDFNEWQPYQRTLRQFRSLFGHSRAPRSFPSLWPVLALDRIWIKPLTLLVATQAHKSVIARVASDHLPVKALFRLRSCFKTSKRNDL